MTFRLELEKYEELQKLQKRPGLSRRRYRKVTVLIMLPQGLDVKVIEAALDGVLPPRAPGEFCSLIATTSEGVRFFLRIRPT
jgi:hypothetical protein